MTHSVSPSLTFLLFDIRPIDLHPVGYNNESPHINLKRPTRINPFDSW